VTVTLESHRIQGLGLGAVHRVEVQWDKHEGYRIYSIDAQGVERIRCCRDRVSAQVEAQTVIDRWRRETAR